MPFAERVIRELVGWGGWGRAAKAHGVANLARLLAPDIWGAFIINTQNDAKAII